MGVELYDNVRKRSTRALLPPEEFSNVRSISLESARLDDSVTEPAQWLAGKVAAGPGGARCLWP